jgi:diaminopimelate epimerase
VGQLQNRLSKDVKVDLPGGSLRIKWPGKDSVLKMTGAAEHIFDGIINI